MTASGFRASASRLLVLLAGLALLASCSHYRLGTGTRLPFHTVWVAPVENPAVIPQAAALVVTVVREALARDGRVALAASPDGADATLQVVLTGYDRETAVVRPGDTGLARKFSLTLRARCTLTDPRDGRKWFENRELRVSRPAFTDGGQQQAEYQALPLLAEALAERIVHTLLDVW